VGEGMFFWFLWGIDLILAFIFFAFFIIGIADGSVSSFNITLWIVIICILAGIIGGSYALRVSGHPVMAIILSLILAIPGLLYALFLLLIILMQPKWN
jgi:hypothetical protein